MSSHLHYFIMSLMAVLLTIALILPSTESKPQIEHGSLNGPSGRFERTRNLAAPPVDLSRPPIYLPEAIPIHEDNGEAPVQPNQPFRAG